MLWDVGVTADGLNESWRPLGEEEALKETDCGEPLTNVTVMVVRLLAPRHMDRVFGLAEIEKPNFSSK